METVEVGVKRLDHITWECHICGARRPDSRISVAKHTVTDGNGITVGHNVRYCNDSPTCEKIARLRNHDQRNLLRWQNRARVAESQAAFWRARFKLLTGTLIGFALVGVGGFVLADITDLI